MDVFYDLDPLDDANIKVTRRTGQGVSLLGSISLKMLPTVLKDSVSAGNLQNALHELAKTMQPVTVKADIE